MRQVELLSVRATPRVVVLPESAVDGYLSVLCSAFLGQLSPASVRRERAAFLARPGAHVGVYDGGELIGVASAPVRPLTLPGGTCAPVSAVTSVAVAPGHRRRGVFAAMVEHQHAESGTALSALWPSQGGLYRRFGFGPATRQAPLTVAHGSRLLPDTRIARGPVRELPRATALPLVRALHERTAADRVGEVGRDDGHWLLWLAEPLGAETDELRFAVHENGYAVYRVTPKVTDAGRAHELHVLDLVAADAACRAALWRHLLDLDLSGTVHFGLATPDEPLTHQLADPRAATRTVRDGMWLRLVDVPTALGLRRYRTSVTLTFSVTDTNLPANHGLWRLAVDDHGVADVARGTGRADLSLGVADLAVAYLGGTSFAELAMAGRIFAATPEVVMAADLAFGHEPAPCCTTVF